MKWVYDRESRELLTKEEYNKRQAERSDKYGKKHFTLPQKFQRGHWKLDKATRKLVPIGNTPKEIAAPYVLTDEIPPTESLAVWEKPVFTSKKKLYDHYKEQGVTVKEKGMLEVNPERVKPTDEKELRDDIAMAANQLRWDEVPLSEKEKAICQKERREMEDYKRRQKYH
jgi:hypothetical protein